MKIPILSFARSHPIASLLVAGALLGAYALLHARAKTDDRLPVSVTGVQHLGSDHLINQFYVDRRYFGNVGEGGGGGSEDCCITLPWKWRPELKAEVRWEVYRIIKTSDPATPETVEVEGIYRAQVPVEAYAEPGNFYVHFFPHGRVRIVVSPISSSGEQHPIQWGDAQASQTATAGTAVKEILTAEEVAEIAREVDRDRARYGDWR
jgi:hypothetical protein